jgi:hypothetical protein
MPQPLDLTAGEVASGSMHVPSEHIRMYAEISGARNPLHFDEDFGSIHASKPVRELKVGVEREDQETVREGEAWCYRFMVEGES